MPTFPSPIVSAQWLAEHHDEVRVVDSRWSIPTGAKRNDFETAHIPGAIFVDLDVDLSLPAGERGRHPLPGAEAFAEVRGRLGMDRPVVVYDDCSGAVAARLWWMLDAIGAEVAVLDGGIRAWEGDLVGGIGVVDRVAMIPVSWPVEKLVSFSEMLPGIEDGTIVLDARSADRFAGLPNPIDARPGHIPGSSSRPWENNIGEDGCFLSSEILRQQLGGQGLRDDVAFIVSCGSGVTACHNLLAAKIAGFPDGELYAGSWSEWSQDLERPVAVTSLG